MKVKAAELTGIALDYAVALASGATAFQSDDIRWFFTLHGDMYALSSGWGSMSYHPSTTWAQGGPLLESEKISVEIKPHGYWMASHQYNYADEKRFLTLGDTPLMAAMRCFVASKLGEEVEIPEKLK